MANIAKDALLSDFRSRFGQLRKLAKSQSLFEIGHGAARVYLRYSKVHRREISFYGLRDIDLAQLEGHNAFICFFSDNNQAPVFLPYVQFEEVFRSAKAASDGQYKVQLI